MAKRAAAAEQHAAAKRWIAAGSAAILFGLWLFGICGLPLPQDINPATNPCGYAAAQLLLLLPILSAVLPLLREGMHALARFHPDLSTLLFLSGTAALADGVLGALRIALAVSRGNETAAKHMSLEMPIVFAGMTLAAAAFAMQKHAWAQAHTVNRMCRFLAPSAVLIAAGILSAELMQGTAFFGALHIALLLLSLCCPVSLLIAAPLCFSMAERCTSAHPDGSALEWLGRAKEICFDDPAVLLQESAALDDLYATDGNKPALLALTTAVAIHTAHPSAAALAEAAAALGLRLPHAGDAMCHADSFGGTVHHRKWSFSENAVAAPELIRRTDFGGRQTLYAYANGAFRGVLLFARHPSPEANAALERLRACGVAVIIPGETHGDAAAFLQKRHEKVLHAVREGATIKLKDADGATLVPDGLPLTALAAAVSLGRRMHAMLGAAAGISAAAVLLCLLAVAGWLAHAGAAVLAAGMAMRLTAVIFVLGLSLFVRRFQPPEISPAKEMPMMFGKVNYTIHVEGMSCSHCAAHVKTALESLRGVSADVNLEEKVARVKCPAALDEKQLTHAVTEAGFTVSSIERV